MLLSQDEAIILLEKYNIKIPKTQVIKRFEDIKKDLIFPAVLKIDSAEVLHKSDYGLVFTNLNSADEIKNAIAKSGAIIREKGIKNYSFVLQESVKGVETIIGMKKDSVFGSVIIFGLGGVFVELIRDVSMRIAPLLEKDCYEMINEIKGKRMLEGFRNFPIASKPELVSLLMKTSRMVASEKDIVELDFNPVIVNERDAVVADARIIKNA